MSRSTEDLENDIESLESDARIAHERISQLTKALDLALSALVDDTTLDDATTLAISDAYHSY